MQAGACPCAATLPPSAQHPARLGRCAARSCEQTAGPPLLHIAPARRAAGIEVEVVQVQIGKGQQRAPEYLALNPLGKVPCLQVRQGVAPAYRRASRRADS